MEVICVFQDKKNLPDGFVCPNDRVKPWGTGHALLSCKGALNGGFVVINADDYYGKDAYHQMSEFLDSLEKGTKGKYAMAGFRLDNTLSDHGGVTRGLCVADQNGYLTSIWETKKIMKSPDGPFAEEPGGMRYLNGDTPVSMNMWAFTPDVLELLEERFVKFLSEGGLEEEKSEFLIPTEIGAMLSESIKVKVLPTPSMWFGMTFLEETPMMRQSLAMITQEGVYPSPLF